MMKVIKSKRLANYLTEKGFKIEKVDIDKANPAYLIFLLNFLMWEWFSIRHILANMLK